MKDVLLYLNEHVACENYIHNFQSGFFLNQYETGEEFQMKYASEFAVIFMMKGRLKVTSTAKETATIKSNEMCSLAPYNNYKIEVLRDTKFIVCIFEKPKILCDQFSISKLAQYYTSKKKNIRVLRMVNPVRDFIKNMEFYLVNKMYCRHLHDLKESEWLFLMRGFYKKEDAANFLAPVIESLNTFKNIVKSNVLKVETVGELAEICNMSTKTFTRRFQKEFDQTPKQWMMAEKSKLNNVTKKMKKEIVGMYK